MKNFNWIVVAALSLGVVATDLSAQDPRERNYYYEILNPSHEPKSPVNWLCRDSCERSSRSGIGRFAGKRERRDLPQLAIVAKRCADVAFDVYREVDGKSKKLNRKPLKTTTDFVDKSPVSGNARYRVVALDRKGKELSKSDFVTIAPETAVNYRSIKLNRDTRAGKVAVADLNGDGKYDYIVRTPASNVDPGMPGDLTGKTYQIEAYLSDGLFVVQRFGQGIEPGI